MSESNADCGKRNAEYPDRKNGTANYLPLTEDFPGRRPEGGCLRMPVAISGSGDCPAKHRVWLNLEIGPKRPVHIGRKTQSPWCCLTQQRARDGGEGWTLRPSVNHTNRFVPLLWPKTLPSCGGQSPLPKTPRTHQVRASAGPRPINQRSLC
jgi:hypothetical protein